ncbi:alpha/beta hydrolase [Paenimyroides aestuarii]|uniref:Alpha/beta hydrolase n=1 Tax=Paenimyroides aestuarii TaxID=2968490 RepID=A0ABY5NW97_9FLAO|nr:alpha/beta fold hydrolase [Paenimyroides aestuarii]UUV22604.1 alpha/beta hydrolase [Paenimyroides aestuarii]
MKIGKKLRWGAIIVFVVMNLIAIVHSYKFTHFSDAHFEKTQRPDQLSFNQKLKILFFGVNNPRPTNDTKPLKFKTVQLQSNKKVEGWYCPVEAALGTVILFHGYGGEKSSMLDKAAIFDSLGYNTFLIDFMGSGGSEGNTTTIGFKEAEQVKTAYNYLVSKGEKEIYLFGTSMGAVAIMKAIKDYDMQPRAIILECPFGTMYDTVAARFSNMNVPTFPMAGLLVFWGGVQNNFWAFSHNPATYAKHISCPTLLLFGEKDKNVSKKEIDEIYNNLAGSKKLKTYSSAGHENYLKKYRNQWTEDVVNFLKSN